ncbi:MAG: MerR family transcriptional regulator [Deltaproteobacteria bacterium]|nr:MerR family transcriptional regulator [Deltaproteobacteria bacterium]
MSAALSCAEPAGGPMLGDDVTQTPNAPAKQEPSLTIDELAAASRIPSRTIRFYQSKGVLGSPTVRGRVAYYGPQHLERLKLIAQLQDRGLRIDAIRALTTRIDKGELDVAEWLGLDAEFRAPWGDDRPRTMTEAELLELAGEARRDGLIADLVRHELVQRQGEVYLVSSPALLLLSVRLEAVGIAIPVAAAATKILEKHLSRASRELSDFILERARTGDDARVEGHVQDLRPIALDAVHVLFAREMERVLREMAESGQTAKLGKKKPR